MTLHPRLDNFDQVNDCYYDTLKIESTVVQPEGCVPGPKHEDQLRYFEDGMHVGVALNERQSNELATAPFWRESVQASPPTGHFFKVSGAM